MSFSYDTGAGAITTRLQQEDAALKAERREKARHNLAAIAIERPDSEAFLRDLIDMLGLRP